MRLLTKGQPFLRLTLRHLEVAAVPGYQLNLIPQLSSLELAKLASVGLAVEV